jgi:hypothetical protein
VKTDVQVVREHVQWDVLLHVVQIVNPTVKEHAITIAVALVVNSAKVFAHRTVLSSAATAVRAHVTTPVVRHASAAVYQYLAVLNVQQDVLAIA